MRRGYLGGEKIEQQVRNRRVSVGHAKSKVEHGTCFGFALCSLIDISAY